MGSVRLVVDEDVKRPTKLINKLTVDDKAKGRIRLWLQLYGLVSSQR